MNNDHDCIRDQIYFRNRAVHVDLWYPRVAPDSTQYVEVGLIDVRAADDLRLSYDFYRDGWKIEQASTFAWDADDVVCDPDWQEVAFIRAWGREKPIAVDTPGNTDEQEREVAE